MKNTTPRTVSAAEFKATCLEILDRVADTRQPVVVTKRGRAVARVMPLVDRPDRVVGAMKGEIDIRGDIVNPLGVTWRAARR